MTKLTGMSVNMAPLCATLSSEKVKNFQFVIDDKELEKQEGREKEIKVYKIKDLSKH